MRRSLDHVRTDQPHGEPFTIRAGRRAVTVSRPDKVLFPVDGVTKRDLAEHYARVASAMLPLVRGHPVALERFPDGIAGMRFYHKNMKHTPEWVRTVKVGKRDGELDQVIVEDAATLVWMADQACITPHIWLSRADTLMHPDQLIVDLDPPEGKFAEARRVALVVRALLDDLGLPSYPKTTGGKGVHVMVPLDRRRRFDEVRGFADRLGAALVADDPRRLTMEFRKEKRGDRLFVDMGRNAYAQHAVAPYAVRPRDGAPVATPLHWSEVEDRRLKPERFTIEAVGARVERGDVPWGPLRGRSLTAAARKLARMGPAARD
jgi:bifunctional non-homologous end joining protein LigD